MNTLSFFTSFVLKFIFILKTGVRNDDLKLEKIGETDMNEIKTCSKNK